MSPVLVVVVAVVVCCCSLRGFAKVFSLLPPGSSRVLGGPGGRATAWWAVGGEAGSLVVSFFFACVCFFPLQVAWPSATAGVWPPDM